uniref:Uncharacterized protein n=1 Tax=Trichuris muris TaxID=70415 RepID=A0A5S6Q697_TRIMR
MSDPNNHEEIWRMVLLSGCIHSAAEKKIEVPQCFSDQYEAMLNKCWSISALRELHDDRKMAHFGYLHIRLGPAAFFPREIFRTCIAKVYKEITDQVQQNDDDEENFIHQIILPNLGSNIRVYRKPTNEGEGKTHYVILPKNRLVIRGATELTTTVLAIFDTDRKLLRAEIPSLLGGVLKVLTSTSYMDPTHSEQRVTVLMDLLHLQYAVLQLVLNCSDEIMEYNKKAVESLPSIIFNIITSIPSEACEFRKDVILLLRMFPKSRMRCLFLNNRSYFMATIGDFLHYLSFNLKPTAAQKGIQMFARFVQFPKYSTHLQTATVGVVNRVLEGMTKALAEPNLTVRHVELQSRRNFLSSNGYFVCVPFTRQFLVQRVIANRTTVTLMTLLFTNRSISSLVMSVLLNYLVEHIEVLADATLYHPLCADADPKANVHARLFQLFLGAVGTSSANDSVFKLHLTKLVNATTSLARQSENPGNALTVLCHVISTVCDHLIFAQDIANLVLSLLKGNALFRRPPRCQGCPFGFVPVNAGTIVHREAVSQSFHGAHSLSPPPQCHFPNAGDMMLRIMH